MGVAYTNMPFHDVMIRALQDGDEKHVAWRHPKKHESMQKIVQVQLKHKASYDFSFYRIPPATEGKGSG